MPPQSAEKIESILMSCILGPLKPIGQREIVPLLYKHHFEFLSSDDIINDQNPGLILHLQVWFGHGFSAEAVESVALQT